MTPFDRLIQSLTSLKIDPWIFAKILALAGLSFYLAFAVIIIRQVKLMSQTLDGTINLSLKIIGWIHLVLAVGVFLLAMVIL